MMTVNVVVAPFALSLERHAEESKIADFLGSFELLDCLRRFQRPPRLSDSTN